MPTRRPFGSVRKRVNFYEASYWYGGRRHLASTSFATKREARAFLAAVETDSHRGGWVDPWAGRMSVRELAGEWTASDPTKRESTTAREELTLRLHIFPVLGERRIERVGPQDVQRLVNSWSDAYAPRTVKRNYEVVRAMFGFAVRNDWLARNPCRNIKLPLVEGTRRHDLTPEDVARIASHIAVEYQPMVWIGATLGLRWSEVAGLRVSRLDLVGGKLSVVETIVRGIGGRNVFGPPKSKAGKRTMFMPAAIVTMLAGRQSSRLRGRRLPRPAPVECDHARGRGDRRENGPGPSGPRRPENDAGYLRVRPGCGGPSGGGRHRRTILRPKRLEIRSGSVGTKSPRHLRAIRPGWVRPLRTLRL